MARALDILKTASDHYTLHQGDGFVRVERRGNDQEAFDVIVRQLTNDGSGDIAAFPRYDPLGNYDSVEVHHIRAAF